MQWIEKRASNNIERFVVRVFSHFDGGFSPMPQVVAILSHALSLSHTHTHIKFCCIILVQLYPPLPPLSILLMLFAPNLNRFWRLLLCNRCIIYRYILIRFVLYVHMLSIVSAYTVSHRCFHTAMINVWRIIYNLWIYDIYWYIKMFMTYIHFYQSSFMNIVL